MIMRLKSTHLGVRTWGHKGCWKKNRPISHTGFLANLEVIGMINEPTTATFAYGLYKFDKSNVLDFGVGTLDFTLLTFIKNDDEITCDIEGSFY